jgi:hypothetical protein
MRYGWALGVAAVAAVVGGAWYWDKKHQASSGGTTGGTGGGSGTGSGSNALPPAGGSGYDVAKWHVAAVTSDYGKSVFPDQTVAGDFSPGDYVLFALAYGGANDARVDPAAIALGQIGALAAPTASGKKNAAVRLIQIAKYNSNYSPTVPPPPAGTWFSVTTDDVQKVLSADEVQKLVGTA